MVRYLAFVSVSYLQNIMADRLKVVIYTMEVRPS
jgi:hypothetical protein